MNWKQTLGTVAINTVVTLVTGLAAQAADKITRGAINGVAARKSAAALSQTPAPTPANEPPAEPTASNGDVMTASLFETEVNN